MADHIRYVVRSAGKPPAWNRFRWWLSLEISRIAWWVMPEPQRSRCREDFSGALRDIKQREGGWRIGERAP